MSEDNTNTQQRITVFANVFPELPNNQYGLTINTGCNASHYWLSKEEYEALRLAINNPVTRKLGQDGKGNLTVE